jgi:hypothetical protein
VAGNGLIENLADDINTLAVGIAAFHPVPIGGIDAGAIEMTAGWADPLLHTIRDCVEHTAKIERGIGRRQCCISGFVQYAGESPPRTLFGGWSRTIPGMWKLGHNCGLGRASHGNRN